MWIWRFAQILCYMVEVVKHASWIVVDITFTNCIYSMGPPQWETHNSQHHQKSHLMLFLAKDWNSFHHMEEIRSPSSRGLSHSWMWIVLEANIDITHAESLMLTAPQIIDLPLKLVGGRRSPPLETINYAIFCSYNEVEMRHTLCWSVSPIQLH